MPPVRIADCPRCKETKTFRRVDDPDLDGYRCPDCLVRYESLQSTLDQSVRE